MNIQAYKYIDVLFELISSNTFTTKLSIIKHKRKETKEEEGEQKRNKDFQNRSIMHFLQIVLFFF